MVELNNLGDVYSENRKSGRILDNREWLKQLTQRPPESVPTPKEPTVEPKKESH